jgi:hypothetical protein
MSLLHCNFPVKLKCDVFQTLEELNELSVKQMKDVLAVNRVNFKGVMEKDELYKILERLWKTEKKLEQGNAIVRVRELFRAKTLARSGHMLHYVADNLS